jgi:FtsP/CotA-like multicopper oxidase with cupredoxin domain
MYTEEARRTVVTEHIDPGRTMSMTWVPEEVGRWIFHCHMFVHMTPHEPLIGQAAASASHSGTREDAGMGGLVLGITVLPAKNTAAQAERGGEPRRLWLYVRERPATPVSLAGISVRLADSLSDEAKEVSVPAPAIVLTRGQPVEITVVNQLSTPTSIHWHGIELESYYDGVAGWGGDSRQTTPNIPPGEKFVARMAPPRAGTFIYHTHWHDVQQMVGGLTGPLVVLEPGQKFNPETDKIFLASRSVGEEGNQLLLLNGNPQPRPVSLRAGTKYRFRFINITPDDSDLRVALLAGTSPVKWRAIAKDGRNLPPAQAREQEALQGITVGETYDFEVQPDKPGELTLQVLAPFSKRWVTMALEIKPSSR